MANPGTRIDAFPAFHFEVDIGGTSYPFRSCSGLSSETKVYEVEEGGVNTHVHKLVGPTSFPNLVLRQGFCNPSSPLYALYQNFVSTQVAKKRFDGFVRQIGPNGTSAKWVFKQGWITKWQGPELDATKHEVSIESIEIVHEGLMLVGPSGAVVGLSSGSAGAPAGTSGTAAGTSSAAAGAKSGITAGASGTLLPGTSSASSVTGSSTSSGASASGSSAASSSSSATSSPASPSPSSTPASPSTTSPPGSPSGDSSPSDSDEPEWA